MEKTLVQQRVPAMINCLSVQARHIAEEAATTAFIALNGVVCRGNAVQFNAGHCDALARIHLDERFLHFNMVWD